MPQFVYTAVDRKGKKSSGVLEANSIADLRVKLKSKDLYVTEAQDAVDVKRSKEIKSSQKVKLKPLAIFCRQFATLINSGITAIKALDILFQQTEDKVLKKHIGQIYESVQKGDAMSDAFRRQGEAFPELFINMILAGESSGTLDGVLLRMADHYEKENKLKNKIKGAMIYPIVLMTLTIAVVILMLVVVLPSFTGIILAGGGTIPLPTRMLLGLSDFLSNYWYLVAGVTILIVISWRAFKRSDKGRLWWDRRKLKMPIVKKSLRMIYSARFARTLSTLLSSGIQMLQSLDITARVINNQVIHNSLNNVVEDIRKGMPLSVSLRKTGDFPPMIYNMINVGEESGLLDDILTKTAAFFDEESDAAIQRLVGLLEPLMIVFMAVIIGFIVIAIALPMFSMYGAVA
ncbi:MAG: type II secretion system F family protein [Clostridiaceae bacterium]|nr:type II secretion system F family protein [Clostridiaceae bacterium]